MDKFSKTQFLWIVPTVSVGPTEEEKGIHIEAFLKAHKKLEDALAKRLIILFQDQKDKVLKAAERGAFQEELENIIHADQDVFRIEIEQFYTKVISVFGKAAAEEISKKAKAIYG